VAHFSAVVSIGYRKGVIVIEENTRKIWRIPKLVVYGSVEDLTQQIKPKQLGTSDDFGIVGISDP
jgi:hypothetical protein